MYIRENGQVFCTIFLFQGRNTKSQGDEDRLFLHVFLWFKFTFNHATIQDCKRIPVALNETLKRCRDITSRPRIDGHIILLLVNAGRLCVILSHKHSQLPISGTSLQNLFNLMFIKTFPRASYPECCTISLQICWKILLNQIEACTLSVNLNSN